jgi:hypothetical protein
MTVYRYIVVVDFNINMKAIPDFLASRAALKRLKLHYLQSQGRPVMFTIQSRRTETRV